MRTLAGRRSGTLAYRRAALVRMVPPEACAANDAEIAKFQ